MKFIPSFFILLLLASVLQAQNCSTFDIVAASSANTISCGSSATLTASPTASSPFTVSYSWSPSLNLSPSNGLAASVVASPKSTTIYTVTATRSDGCVKTKQVSVAVTNNISITQTNPSSLQPWLTSGSRMNLTVTGLNNPIWSENEAHIVLVNPSSATVTVRSAVGISTVMPNSTVTVTGSNVSPGCPASASVSVLGVNADFFPNGLITNCDGNNTKVLTAIIPPALVQNYRFDWYKMTNGAPVFVSSGNTLTVTKTGLGTARYFPQVVPINTTFPIIGNQSTLVADVRFSTQPTPVTQGTSPANPIPLTCGVPVTIDNLCYADTYNPQLCNFGPARDVFFRFTTAQRLTSPPNLPESAQGIIYGFNICSNLDLYSEIFGTTCEINAANDCMDFEFAATALKRGGSDIVVVQGLLSSNQTGPITIKFNGAYSNCSATRKGVVNADNHDAATEVNANIVANPLNTSIDISLPSADISKVSILNLQGQEVKALEMSTSSAQIPVAELSNGIYLVNVHQNGQLFNAKVNISK